MAARDTIISEMIKLRCRSYKAGEHPTASQNEESSMDEQQFLEVAERYKGVIYRICYIYASDSATLADYYQEALANMWSSRNTFRGDCSEGTWVYRIALYTCLSFVRKQRRRPAHIPLAVDIDLYDDDQRNGRIREMYALVSRLAPADKALILLWLEERSYDEIARITGLTRSNVAVKLMRIKEKLQKMSNE